MCSTVMVLTMDMQPALQKQDLRLHHIVDTNYINQQFIDIDNSGHHSGHSCGVQTGHTDHMYLDNRFSDNGISGHSCDNHSEKLDHMYCNNYNRIPVHKKDIGHSDGVQTGHLSNNIYLDNGSHSNEDNEHSLDNNRLSNKEDNLSNNGLSTHCRPEDSYNVMLHTAFSVLKTFCGSSTVAIDNKIEQAMDLVKSHLMYAVREEVEVLKEQIKELIEKNNQLEYENSILKTTASPETIAKLSQPRQSQQPPSSSS